MDIIKLTIKRKLWIILEVFRNCIKSFFHGSTKISMSHYHTNVTICMTSNCLSLHFSGDIVKHFVNSYPELTRWLEMYVPISSTVPVYCIAIDHNVKFAL